MGRGGHLPLRPRRHARRGVLHRHAAADRVGIAAHGIGLRLRPDRRHRPLPAHAGLDALLPDGLGRQRAADRATGPERLRGDLRPLAPLRPRLHAARGAGQGRRPGQPAQLRRALPPAHGRGRAGLRGPVAARRALGRLGDGRTPPSTTAAGEPASACSCATWPEARPTPPRRRRCGTSSSRPRWPRPRWRTANRTAPTTACDSTTSRSRPPDPSWSPPAWRWWRTPTTPATPPASAPPCTRRSSASRCRCWPTSSPNRTRARASP